MNRSYILLSLAIVSACATTPTSIDQLSGEKVEFFATAPDAPEVWAARGVAGTAPKTDWLGQFNDPKMIELISEALENNPTRQSRAALVRAAEAFSRVSRSQTRPNLSLTATAGGTSTGVEVAGQDERFNDPLYGLSLDGSWELDLWDRLSTGVAAADADYAASEADLAATELSIAAQTANAWISLNQALALERVAVLTFEARDRVLTLTERRFARGLSTALDVRTVRAERAGAEATIAARRQASQEAARRLETLLGRYPEAEITAPAILPELDEIAPEGNPALLLSRRPDIAALEARVLSAGLSAEQARLAMLPSLRLSTSASTSSTELEDIIDPATIAARLIASLAQPIFNGGRLDAQRDAAIAQAEASMANYANGALSAWREVENALAADVLLAVQEDAQRRSLEEATYAAELAERQYTSGTITIFNLISAQTRKLNAESQLIVAQGNRAANRIGYHVALGGGLPVSVAETEDTIAVDIAADEDPAAAETEITETLEPDAGNDIAETPLTDDAAQNASDRS